MGTIQKIETGHQSETEIKPRNSTFSALEWIRDSHLPATDKALLYSIASHIDANYEWCLSRETLTEEAGIKNIATVTRHIKKLCAMGMIQVEKIKPKNGGWQYNKYRLLVPPKYKVRRKKQEDQYVTLNQEYVTLSQNKMTQSHTYYPDYPLTTKLGDKPKGENSGTCVPEIKNQKLSEKSLQGEVSPIVKKKAAPPGHVVNPFPVSAKFSHTQSGKARVAHWWSCVQAYRPAEYDPKKTLGVKRVERLYEFHNLYAHDPGHALRLIEWSIRNWAAVTVHMVKPPKIPTPAYLVQEHTEFEHYMQTHIKGA